MKPAHLHRAARDLLLTQVLAALVTAALAQSDGTSVVVAMYNISAPAGSQAVLQCHSQRMVWTQDRLKDRQRVVHWDLFRSAPDYAMERVLDMFSAGDQRIYNAYNKNRISLAKSAFTDGNFSLVIKDVVSSDKGLYSCNLHHHYCHLYESIKVQLNVTKSARKERKFWDGEKAVFVVLVGSTVVLPCVNRRSIWTDGGGEEQQQVVHWDRQSPGVRHDRADRLVDLYASGERRHYGPLFLRERMNITAEAFAYGDFSLVVSDLSAADQGLYSCHLHHHYCGLHERRIFRLTVTPALPTHTHTHTHTHTQAPAPVPTPAPTQPSSPSQALPNKDPNSGVVDGPRVINVILPDQRAHFLQQLGYILATLLLLALVLLAIVLLTRRAKGPVLEYDPRKMEKSHMSANDLEMVTTEMKIYQDEPKLDYKNNLLKEKAELTKMCSPKAIDLDKEMAKACSY
ncbi:LOW QUALITY PROTEIN: matrix remodeling-associated protein 8a [Alosa sapidissima]|uniref:LOW QUALITY PROTEIN: matrix remodeling-associated protein 8a n=1 Tax=Alosa sapidissima TaxID=34773 RepID=UPI001C0A26FC|nr:LOW QUALITY PROTEIN: matrix remodeling-associated protein 8a [Alosa sapidissima]